MPDWSIHVALAGAGGFRVFRDRALLLTGAVLPDIGVVGILVFCDFLGFHPLDAYLRFGPLHTPFLSLVLSLSIALLFRDVGRAFLALAAGVFSHFLLDFAQLHLGAGLLLLYPFSGREFSLGLVLTDGREFLPVSFAAVPAVALVAWRAARRKGEAASNPADLRGRRVLLSALAVAIWVGLPFLTPELLVSANAHYSQFFLDPASHVGKKVGFARSRVVGVDPVVVEEMGREFTILGIGGVRPGDWISAEGRYDGSVVMASRWVLHVRWAKPVFSLVGLLAVAFVWWVDPRARRLFGRFQCS